MVNRKYKDRLFRKIFGYEKYKPNLLDLYNALNNTNYDNPEELEINTIDDVIYMGMKNDVSCMIDSRMALYEQQSTWNPNMPLRGFMYFGKLFSKYIQLNHINLFSTRQVKIPTPQYYVFYNGKREQPDRVELKLSDAFIVPEGNENFEWTAVVLNINFGHNKELMNRCSMLNEYAILIGTIRKYEQDTGYAIEEGVTRAVDECIENDILKEFLQEHKSEVIEMCLTEYNEVETMEMFRKEALTEGLETGRAEGQKQGRLKLKISLICKKLKKHKTVEEIAEDLEESIDEVSKICKIAEKYAPQYDEQAILQELDEDK